MKIGFVTAPYVYLQHSVFTAPVPFNTMHCDYLITDLSPPSDCKHFKGKAHILLIF